tara:strand:- start:5001 stop:7247 length:2247 start_codon:yes stop_codon:yes gene_type:complete
MSNKLTDERLNELILEVMSESTSTSQPPQPNQNNELYYSKPEKTKDKTKEEKFENLILKKLRISITSAEDLPVINDPSNFARYLNNFKKKNMDDFYQKTMAFLEVYKLNSKIRDNAENSEKNGYPYPKDSSPTAVFANTRSEKWFNDEIKRRKGYIAELKGAKGIPNNYKKTGNWTDEQKKQISNMTADWIEKIKNSGMAYTNRKIKERNSNDYIQFLLTQRRAFKAYRKEYTNIFKKYKKSLKLELTPDASQASSAFDLKRHSQSTGEIEGFDIYGTKNIFKTNFKKLGLELDDQTFQTLQDIISDAFADKKTFQAISNLKEVATTKTFNINDLAALFKDIEKASDKVTIPNTRLKIDATKIKASLKKAYQAVMIDDRFQDKARQAALNSIKDLRDSVDYFASKRNLRTKTGAQTGFTLGTAETSGTARTSKALASTFSNISLGQDVLSRFRDLEKFLNETNTMVLQGKGGLSGNLQQRFSRFVALEILNKQIFRTQEATAAGTLFESFLAMFLGGAQTGGDRGASDFTLPNGDAGSAKLVSDFKFQQSAKGLQADPDMLYVVAIKSTETQSGIKKLTAGEKERIQAIDIHLYQTITTDTNDGWEYKALPINNKTLEVVGSESGTQAVFGLSSDDLKASYIARLDFSFMFEKEFEDVSSQIMKGVAEEVEQAFSALTNLKNNITSWISEKDLIAANQVTQDQQQLNDAVDKMRKDTTKFAVSENKKKSLKDLDKLIERVILESMNKK